MVPGGHGEGDTPEPIPNSEVKPFSADDTARVTLWESRTLPGTLIVSGGQKPPFLKPRKPKRQPGFLIFKQKQASGIRRKAEGFRNRQININVILNPAGVKNLSSNHSRAISHRKWGLA